MHDALIWVAVIALALLLAAVAAFAARRLLRRTLDEARVRRRLALFPERNPQPVLSVSFDGRVRYANPAAHLLANGLRAHGEVAKVLPSDLVDHIGVLLNSGRAEDRWEYLHQSSVLQCSVHCMEDLGVCHVYLKDLTAQHVAESLLDHHSLHDLLTGLPNQRAFNERLAGALADGAPAAVLLLHLDRFRALMETLGHATGETLLRVVATRLAGLMVSLPGCAVHRFEGALFAVFCPRLTDATSLADLAAQMKTLMMPAFHIDGRELYFTFSMGASRAPEDGGDAATLLRRADTALQHVKREGGDGFQLYFPALDAQAVERLELEHALTHAAARGELTLKYQPQIRVSDGRMVGVEALVRWRHPTLGEIPLTEFIPLAESSGAIVAIGEWVLRTACERAQAWQAAGLPPLTVAVNLSPRQFRSPYLMQQIEACLAQSRLTPRWLEIEITESAAMHDIEQAAAILDRLKALGVQLALDDFGTGHSALAWLRRFPVDKLKLDQSFVRTMESDPANAAIVRAVIALGREMGLVVLAEGVEEAGQLAMLRAMRCDQVQGYLFSKPLTEPQLLELLAGLPPEDTSPPAEKRGELHAHPTARVHPLRP
ncbi:MAG: EAL domain-containing protein [Gammaproteobacteria bacterium]|nr:EAL domain-containing protein [Gammaproteobacteria bacterium]